MSIFCPKKLAASTMLGDRLRLRREERKLTLQDIANATQIQKKYLLALEQSAFNKLPNAKTFRLAYVKSFAESLGVPSDEATEQFIREGGLSDIVVRHPHAGIKQFPFASITSLARFGLLIGGTLLFGIYLTLQVAHIVRPPHLLVFAPFEGQVVNQPSTIIQGETEPESALTINGEPIMVNEQGRFETKIDLSQGVNTLTLSATKKHGRTTVLTRHLLAKLPKNLGQVSLKENENSDKVGL